MAEVSGTLVDHYRLVATIGSGGFSTVYQAIDERLEAPVAIKILAENHALDPDVRERFLAEARLLRRIAGPAVVAVHDIGETEWSQPYLVMSYADRGDLGSRANALWTRSAYEVTPGEALLVADALATGLGRAHRAGLVHRDVKPANLLLASQPDGASGSTAVPALVAADEQVLLSDLGFGKDLGASSGLTVGGGTYGFAAPEQRAPHGTVDPRADVHAASALVYWLFTRRTPPDDGADLHLSPLLPPSLVPVLGQGLATDPARRPATIEAWFAQIAAALDSPTGTNRQTTSATPAGRPPEAADGDGALRAVGDGADRARRPPRRRWLGPVLALLLGLGAGAVGALRFGSTADPGPTVTPATDGGQVVTAERDGLRLAVTGPVSVEVGDRIELSASTEGAGSVAWFAPAGGTGDGDSLTLDAARPGVATITAVAADELGRTVQVEFEVAVDPAG